MKFLFGFPNRRPTLQRFIVSRTALVTTHLIGFEKKRSAHRNGRERAAAAAC